MLLVLWGAQLCVSGVSKLLTALSEDGGYRIQTFGLCHSSASLPAGRSGAGSALLGRRKHPLSIGHIVTARSLPERKALCVWTQQGARGSIILWSLCPTLSE